MGFGRLSVTLQGERSRKEEEGCCGVGLAAWRRDGQRGPVE